MRIVQLFCCVAFLLATSAGCLRIKSDPVKVEPIRITIDVNLKVQRDLEEFFGELDEVDPSKE
jgi:hypothetical protein